MRKFSILVAAMAAFVAQPALAEIGRIKNVTSGVQILRDGRTITARSGLKLEEGDVITTGSRSRVGITLSDDTRMALGPNSRVTLDEYEYDRRRQTGRSVTSINRGSLGVTSGSITRSGRDRMRVRTPTSTLGVRGTTFVVEVSG
ncbi:FecR domain-containing protein [Erythrobacter sp. Alg231-14]|uniref:FecR domain-containing protein n=1 Tax=Erythrobacter sp. Alg231-14 TaxID=1922225 RepID=UPI000D55250D